MAEKKQFKKTSVKRLTDSQKLTLLALLISEQKLFDRASDKLTSEHLTAAFPNTLAYSAVWRAVTDFYLEHGCIPSRELLEIRLKEVIDDNSDDLTAEDIDDIDTFLEETFNSELPKADSPSTVSWVDRTLQQLLTESLADRAARLISSGGGTLTADLPSLLDKMAHEAHRIITSDNALLGAPLFGDDWDTQEMVTTRTSGVDVIDRFTSGEVVGEVVIIAGPYGSCKSLLAVNSCVLAAKRWSAIWNKHLQSKSKEQMRRPVVIYVSYETPRAEFQRRVLANAAYIPYQRLMSMKKLSDLRGPGDKPAKYEEKLYAGTSRKHVCEKERAQYATRLANQHIMFVDMTGKDPALQHYGQDGIQELTRVLRSIFDKQKDLQPVVMWVDHTAEMADEYAIANGIDDKDKISMLRMLPKQLSKIGSEFGMPVYQIHQLSGEANSKGSTARLQITDMEGCKSLARSCDFMLLINKPADSSGAVHTIMSCVKHRRYKPPQKELVLRIQGTFMSVNVDDKFAIDTNSRLILPRSLMNEIHGPTKKTKSTDTFSQEIQG